MDWSKYYPANYTAITEEDIKMIKEMKNKPPVDEDASNDQSDDGEGLDKVDPKAVKKKFKDRKDKDIDNDGDTDDSDEYLHKKRKAVSKAVDEVDEVDEASYNPMRARRSKKKRLQKKGAGGMIDQATKRIQKMKRDGEFDVDEAVDIAKETSALAKVTRGKDRIAIEGAASLLKKGKYDDLASYLDKMQEEPRQSVMMVMMNDQKIADRVMKKMRTENTHPFLMAEMTKNFLTRAVDGLSWQEIGERLIKTPERRLVALAYATKLGNISAPSPEVQKLADECTIEDLEKATSELINDDSDLQVKEAESEAEKKADAERQANAKKAAAMQNQGKQDANKKADANRGAQQAQGNKDQEKRAKELEKEREAKKKAQAAKNAKAVDDPSIKSDGPQTSTRGKVISAVGAALEGLEIPDGQTRQETIDARRKVFKEKIKKLAYEKAKAMLAKKGEPDPAMEAKKEEDDDLKVKETGKVTNKVKMDPDVKESAGVSFVRKYKQKLSESHDDAILQNQILEMIGSSFGSTDGEPAGAEFATDDSPASATSIARALKASPMKVQKMLDDMVEAGQITRQGDAYSYAHPKVCEPAGSEMY